MDKVIHWDWDTYEKESKKQPGEYYSTVSWFVAVVLDHLRLAALAEGLGTCWVATFDEVEIRQILSIPDDVRAQLMMALLFYPQPLS